MTAPMPGDVPGLVQVPGDGCTLPTADRPLRVAEFDALFATALREVHRPAPGTYRARVVLAGDHSLPTRVQQLADAESACCSFYTFTVSRLDPRPSGAPGAPGETVVALNISVPPARAGVLALLVDRADAARPAVS